MAYTQLATEHSLYTTGSKTGVGIVDGVQIYKNIPRA